jgi:hypothetical protein
MKMSMELYILSERRVASITEWQHSIDATGFAVRLSTDRSFAALQGALPVLMNGTLSQFECDHRDVEEFKQTYPEVQFARAWKCALAMCWGADLDAAFCAYVAGIGYARATDGAIFDSQEGAVVTVERAIKTANELAQSKPIMEAAVRKVMQGLRQQ